MERGRAAYPSVFLIGYRGSGKTSVGRSLAQKLHFGLEDTDLLVEFSTGMTIARYFAEAGESAFRTRESEALQSLVRRMEAGEKMVVATGGGIILSRRNSESLRRAGYVVWLAAPVETLRERIQRDPASAASRPALEGSSSVDEVEKVLREREPLYRAAAHAEIFVGCLSPEEITDRILRVLPRVAE